MATIQEIIEKRYTEYLEKVKDWTEDMPAGRTGLCDLCDKRSQLTEHHLVPKRVYKDSQNKLKSFLDKLTISICISCHGKLHPENTWKKDLLELEHVFKAEAEKLEAETQKRLDEQEKIVSKTKEELNNLQSKYTQSQEIVKGKESSIFNSKKEIAALKSKIAKKEEEIQILKEELDKSVEEYKVMEAAAHVFYNTLGVYKDEEKWKKDVLEMLKKEIGVHASSLERKEAPSIRDVNLLLKKITMMPMSLKSFDAETVGLLSNNIQRIYTGQLKQAVADVLEIPLKDIDLILKDKTVK